MIEMPYAIHGNKNQGNLHHRPRTQGGLTRLFRPRFLPERIRRSRTQAGYRAGKYRLQLQEGHAARDAFPIPPAAETKLVRCTRGAILDIIVDLRPESPAYLQNIAVELNEENGRALYVPEGFAHGYQTLEDDTEVFYQMGNYYTPDDAAGLRFDDPKLGIQWPLPVASISEKDLAWPLL
jgi:hypothetical protein